MSQQIVRTNTRWDDDDTYTICGKIGQGGNADVFLIKNGDDNFYVLKVSKLRQKDTEAMIERETEAFKQLNDCPRRIKLIDSSSDSPDGLYDNEYPWIIMDYVPGTTLFEFLEHIRGPGEKPANDLKPSLKYSLIYSIAREIYDIHQKGYTHRDIKPDNIFIDCDLWPHIGDFGDLTPNLLTYNVHGTINFLPPEAFPLNPSDGIQCGHPYDVYGFGGTLLQIISFEWPFSDLQVNADFEQRVKERLRQGDFENRFEPGGELQDQIFPEDRDLYEIVKLCWTFDPEKRPTMETILELIDESAHKHLNQSDLSIYESYKDSYSDDDDYDDLGRKENVLSAIQNGFISLSSNAGLMFAAQSLGEEIEQSNNNLLEAISEQITPSYRSACPHSHSYN